MTTKNIYFSKVTPKFIPFLCPVCHGHKTVNWGKQVCAICKGEGFIKVPPKEYENSDISNKS